MPITAIGTEVAVQIGRATTLDARGESANERLVLTDWRAGDPEGVFELMPDGFCPIAGTVAQARGIACDELRQFMASVFTMPSVFRGYRAAPGSRDHHHAYVGGLAQHSLEVAALAPAARDIESWQHDLLVAYALLHDVGKVWS